MFQSKLPFKDKGVDFMCLNKDCFYVEAIMSIHDLVFKNVWNSRDGTLESIPHCPSCGEVSWREENGTQIVPSIVSQPPKE